MHMLTIMATALQVVHPYDVGDAVLVGPNQDWCNVSVHQFRLC